MDWLAGPFAAIFFAALSRLIGNGVESLGLVANMRAV